MSDLLKKLQDRLNGVETPETSFKVHERSMMDASIAELQEAIKANPKHPVALTYGKTVKLLNPNQTVSIEKKDLEALLGNKKTETKVTVIEGVPTTQKVLKDEKPETK